MIENPYSTSDASLLPVTPQTKSIFRVLPALACWLISLGFLAHGLLLGGEYFANNSPRGLSQTGKLVLMAVILTPIAVSGLTFMTGCQWIVAANKRALRWTMLSAMVIIGYAVYFLWLIL